jgi:hypothetical protein
MIRPVDDNCGECKKPVGKSDRQQIFLYPKLKAWKRVCGPCLLKLRPETR